MSRSFESRSLTVLPSIEIVPPLISSRPASIRSSVDLPHPDGPTSTMNSPSAMSKLMPWMTFVAPKDFSMFWNETEAIFGYQESVVRGQTRPAEAPAGGRASSARIRLRHDFTAPAVRPDCM